MKYLAVKGASFAGVCYSDDGQYLVSLNSRSILRFWHLASFDQRLSVTVEAVNGAFSGLHLLGRYAVFPDCVRNMGAAWDWLQSPTRDKPPCPAVPFDGMGTFPLVAPILERQQIFAVWPPWPRTPEMPAGIWQLDGKRLAEGKAPEISLPFTVLPGGTRAAFLQGKRVLICEVLKTKPLADLVHTDRVLMVRFSADGKYMASGAGRSVWLWDVEAKKSLARFPAFLTFVKCVAFHPTGRLLAGSNKEGDVRFYDTRTLREVSRFSPSVGAVHSLAFAPDGTTITAGGRGRIAVWDIDDA